MYAALIALPLSTFCALGLFGRFLGPRGTIILSISSAVLCALISSVIFYEVALCSSPVQLMLNSYFQCELFDAHWGFLFDTLTAVMCVVVTYISCLVIIYSSSYMIMDPHFIRFISYLKLFSVAMLILISADNYIQLFVGWEGVGLASFLLISFWYTRLQASKAAIQAMLLNRVGDLGLALGIISLFFLFKSTNYHAIFACSPLAMTELPAHNLTVLGYGGMSMLDSACILLFIGAMGKSGQFLLHAWLPNAMNAPTPVSALLHAATMVTAGVFLLARSSHLYECAPTACTVVTIIGAITTLFAGTIGLVQNDFKSIIAYSTCSQLGYMVTICGLSSYNVAIFHLFNHAFFKALLFLTAGAVIHGLANEQDVRKFGGLQQLMIFSYSALLIGTMALVGIPFLTGFYSKDVILECAAARFSIGAHFSYLLTCFSVLTTSYYSFRLLFMVFHSGVGAGGVSKTSNVHKQSVIHSHDADNVMILVLTFLALGSVYAGWFFKPMFIGLGTDFWNNAIYTSIGACVSVEAEFLPQSVKLLPLILTGLGCAIAYGATLIFTMQSYKISTNQLHGIYTMLSARWFYDRLLNSGIGLHSYILGQHFVAIYEKGLLELVPFFGLGLGDSMKKASSKLGLTQSGYISHYAALMIVTAIICSIILSGSGTAYLIDQRILVILFACLLV